MIPLADQLLQEGVVFRKHKKKGYMTPILTDISKKVTDILGIGDVRVSVSFKKLAKNQYGVTLAAPDQTDNFKISLNSENGFDMVVIGLCHELVHVRQLAQGDMVISKTQGVVIWKGKEYKIDQNNPTAHSYKDYRNKPWEEEAHTKEKELFTKMKKMFKDVTIPGLGDFTFF